MQILRGRALLQLLLLQRLALPRLSLKRLLLGSAVASYALSHVSLPEHYANTSSQELESARDWDSRTYS
jgi:hypothetical protein